MGNGIGGEIQHMESRTYVIGREGHIYINDPTVSKQHAEIQIAKGEVYLRDLGSTNGTYLIKNNRLVPFNEGYVQLRQPIVIGNRQYTIHSLLEIAGAFAAQYED
ncbi:MAG: FHA domain-containing protein [Gammaproteobacteria bacterium]|nr:FHA domain-containing protein [Gammaproteobacteria bacterium]